MTESQSTVDRALTLGVEEECIMSDGFMPTKSNSKRCENEITFMRDLDEDLLSQVFCVYILDICDGTSINGRQSAHSGRRRGMNHERWLHAH